MNNYSTQIKQIKKKFNQAKETDKEFKVFGASKHKYQLGRTVFNRLAVPNLPSA